MNHRPLTERQRQVLSLAAEGRTDAGIAAKLGISEETVAFHFKAVFRKLQCCSRVQALNILHARVASESAYSG
jgi:DNA-binding NarL/FixJ family response regulator